MADYVVSWRERLRLDQSGLAARMGMHQKTVERMEDGASVRATTLAALERALGWTPGSARRVLGGGNPTPLERESDPEDTVSLAINALVDMKVHGADRATYYLSVSNWARELADEGAEIEIEAVLREVDRKAAEILARQNNPAAGTG